VTGFNFTSLIIAIIGAVILLAILRAFGMFGGRGVGHRV
ncbi:GlsB/YeaQ/YmgE family stress response membrane protein, partial [Candidatus Saccharibacteria bacterium]|nr:GlsB/YeaQ/YmgE family stress response membrane protein [Candidatus Saccharibacteria bacterium]